MSCTGRSTVMTATGKLPSTSFESPTKWDRDLVMPKKFNDLSICGLEGKPRAGCPASCIGYCPTDPSYFAFFHKMSPTGKRGLHARACPLDTIQADGRIVPKLPGENGHMCTIDPPHKGGRLQSYFFAPKPLHPNPSKNKDGSWPDWNPEGKLGSSGLCNKDGSKPKNWADLSDPVGHLKAKPKRCAHPNVSPAIIYFTLIYTSGDCRSQTEQAGSCSLVVLLRQLRKGSVQPRRGSVQGSVH